MSAIKAPENKVEWDKIRKRGLRIVAYREKFATLKKRRDRTIDSYSLSRPHGMEIPGRFGQPFQFASDMHSNTVRAPIPI